MDDLAENVIEQLKLSDGKGPCAAVCSTERIYNQPSTYAVVLPVTKCGMQSFNIDFVEEETNVNNSWVPHASFNVVDVQEVATALLHWKSTVTPGNPPLLIEIAGWKGYPQVGVGGNRHAASIPGFGKNNRKEHMARDDIVETMKVLEMMRAPVVDARPSC